MKGVIVTPNERKFLTNAGDRMPLGALYVATAMERNGIRTDVLDLNHTHWLDAVDKIINEKPEFVGLSLVSSPTVRQMRRFAKEIGGHTGNIVVGGIHATARPFDLEDIADLTIEGEGESRLVNWFASWDSPEFFDINRYPIPDRSKLPKEKYGMRLMGKRAAGMVTARGCPFQCGFCGNLNKQVKHRDTGNIREEVAELKGSGYEAAYLYDESFGINRRHADEVGRHMKDFGLAYRVETRANLVTPDLAKMLKDTGCIMAALGIESPDDKVLKAIHKSQNPEQVERAIALLSENGIATKGYFIFGLPEQTPESAQGTIDFATRMKARGLKLADFYTLTPFPGSPIGDNPNKYGVRPLTTDYRKYLVAGKNGVRPMIETNWMTQEQIKHFCEKARATWKN